MNAPAREHLRGMPRTTLQALRAELGPAFVNAQQRAFFDSQAAEVLYSGAFRAGKSLDRLLHGAHRLRAARRVAASLRPCLHAHRRGGSR